MTLTQAQQAVVDFLVAEPDSPSEAPATSPRQGWVSKVGGNWKPGADPSTVQIRKSRAFEASELHSAEFSARNGYSATCLVMTQLDDTGAISVDPIGGGGGGAPHRDHPWVNLACQWTSTVFRGGGEVIGDGADDVSLVRMRFADGTIAEDDVDDGIVLFEVLGPIAFPVEIALLDARAVQIHSYNAFEDFE